MKTEKHSANEDNSVINADIDINEILAKYQYHWPLFIIGLILSLSAAFLYLRYTKPIYQSSATLLIKDEKKGMSSDDILTQIDFFGDSKVVENELEVLQSKTLMRAVVSRLCLNVDFQTEGRVIDFEIYDKRPVNFISVEMNKHTYDHQFQIKFPDSSHYLLKNTDNGRMIKGSLNQLQNNEFGVYKIERRLGVIKLPDSLNLIIKNPLRVTDDYLSKLAVTVVGKQSTVLSLSIQGTIPQRCSDIINTLIAVYNEAALADKNRTTQSTTRFIDERLALISGELNNVEKEVELFKSDRGLTDISGEAELYLENVKNNDAQLSTVNLQLGAIRDIERYINSNSIHEKLPSTFGINDPVLLGQITQLSELQLKRDQLQATTQSNNPLLEPINKQIETTRGGIRTNVQNISTTLQNTKDELNRNNLQYESSIKKIPGQERQFISIKRQQSIKEALYLYLLQKKEEAALSYAATVADSRVIDAAYSSNYPIKPRKFLIYLIALAAGIILPIGYIYIKDILNNRVIKLADITKHTKVPVLGEIIYDEDFNPLEIQTHSRKAIAEQIRAIRTNLQFVHAKQSGGRVTLFTSSISGEGKSFVASNIGAALALSGRKTVILELDMRKPKISKYLLLTNKIGLSNYLIGKVGIEDIILPSGLNPNLFVVSSGPIPPNPSELLIQDDIEVLIDYLRKNFDEILIDTPPIGLVTDAQILSRITDATIYIVRHGVTLKKHIEQIDELYQLGNFPKLNIILNGIQLQGTYGYGYVYEYSQDYGYYSDSTDKKRSLKSLIKNLFKRF